jgi:hypothetical protein
MIVEGSCPFPVHADAEHPYDVDAVVFPARPRERRGGCSWAGMTKKFPRMAFSPLYCTGLSDARTHRTWPSRVTMRKSHVEGSVPLR